MENLIEIDEKKEKGLICQCKTVLHCHPKKNHQRMCYTTNFKISFLSGVIQRCSLDDSVKPFNTDSAKPPKTKNYYLR